MLQTSRYVKPINPTVNWIFCYWKLGVFLTGAMVLFLKTGLGVYVYEFETDKIP